MREVRLFRPCLTSRSTSGKRKREKKKSGSILLRDGRFYRHRDKGEEKKELADRLVEGSSTRPASGGKWEKKKERGEVDVEPSCRVVIFVKKKKEKGRRKKGERTASSRLSGPV